MYNNVYLKTIIMFFSIMFVTGCSSGANIENNNKDVNENNPFKVETSTKKDKQNENKSLEKLILIQVKEKVKSEILELSVSSTYYENKMVFATFEFKTEGRAYTGLIYAQLNEETKKWIPGYMDVFSTDDTKALSVIKVSGKLIDQDRNFDAVLGNVVDDRIKEIYIEYPSNIINLLKIDEGQKTYLDVEIGRNIKPLSVTAKGNNGKIIIEYDMRK